MFCSNHPNLHLPVPNLISSCKSMYTGINMPAHDVHILICMYEISPGTISIKHAISIKMMGAAYILLSLFCIVWFFQSFFNNSFCTGLEGRWDFLTILVINIKSHLMARATLPEKRNIHILNGKYILKNQLCMQTFL